VAKFGQIMPLRLYARVNIMSTATVCHSSSTSENRDRISSITAVSSIKRRKLGESIISFSGKGG
jgi:hypothetical protein